MPNMQPKAEESLDSAIRDLAQEFGFWSVCVALFNAARIKRRARNDVKHLPDYLLRDIGAPVVHEHLKPPRFNIWDIRL
ncbi:hypothetical protein ACFSE1_00450 [Rhizobium helianthi]|uniref:DUF1127 domain-containing protein n=1 Tax=Rhizobium helianthi TaxID=1132695 RepID=A0ABW4M0I8_9HYPH